MSLTLCIPRRRYLSGPPVGAVPVPLYSLMDEWAPPRVTRDDLVLRPSQTVMYQSVASQPQPFPAFGEPTAPTAPAQAGYNCQLALLRDMDFDRFNWPQVDPSLMDLISYPLLDLSDSPNSHSAPNFGFFDSKPVRVPFIKKGSFSHFFDNRRSQILATKVLPHKSWQN